MNNSDVRLLVIGDPHFKIKNARETDMMTKSILDVIDKNVELDGVVLLGDILDRYESIHVSPLCRAVSLISEIVFRKLKVYLLIGNHDLKNNKQFCSDEHPFTAIKNWENVVVVDTTVIQSIKDQIFTFVPYVPPGRFEEALNMGDAKTQGVSWMNSSAIFAHQEFKGCKMGAIVSEAGDKWPITHPYVISGHIHDFQEPQQNIIYTGTPIQHSFGDTHNKSIFIFTFTNKESREYKKIDLGLPKKQIVRIDCKDVNGYLPRSNCELKITISGTSGELRGIMKHPNVELWKREGHKVTYKDIPLESNNSDTLENYKNYIHKSYSQILYESLNQRPELSELYVKIFGNM
jgi:Marseillevirus putative DNA repair exonuclease